MALCLQTFPSTGAELVAGYLNGRVKWSEAGPARFPGTPHVHIDYLAASPERAGSRRRIRYADMQCRRSTSQVRFPTNKSKGIHAAHSMPVTEGTKVNNPKVAVGITVLPCFGQT